MNEIRRGEEAKRLMDEPLLKEAFSAVEEAIIQSLRRVDVGASNSHRDLIVSLQLLGKVRKYLTDTIATGKMAQMDEEKRHWADKFKRRA